MRVNLPKTVQPKGAEQECELRQVASYGHASYHPSTPLSGTSTGEDPRCCFVLIYQPALGLQASNTVLLASVFQV